MTQTKAADPAGTWAEPKPTALLVLADGTVLEGFGLGATGHAVGEVCFNTAMTGYEEILTDPSYAGQIITFTFPHIGNVGTNEEDIETVNMAATPGARGVILRTAITDPSNYRATRHLDQWLKARGIIGLSGIDTRALTALIRSKGMPNAVIAHSREGKFDIHGLKEEAREWPGLEGMDLVPMVTSGQRFTWDETPWVWNEGFGQQTKPEFNVVAIDYGIKRNILRLIVERGARVVWLYSAHNSGVGAGVLVSDFYAGYNAIPCPQQKCLVHLIRDLNGDLLANIHDQEYKGLAKGFGASCTFHAFVLDADRHLRYEGRFDDSRFEARVTSHDLRNAIDDLLAGRDVRVAQTRAFGCSLDLV